MREATQADYDLLSLPRGASADEVKRAYRHAALAAHPDLHPGDESAASRFSALRQAYEAIVSRPLHAVVPVEHILFPRTRPQDASLAVVALSELDYHRLAWLSFDAVSVGLDRSVRLVAGADVAPSYSANSPLPVVRGRAGYVISFVLAAVHNATWPAVLMPRGVEVAGVYDDESGAARLSATLTKLCVAAASSSPHPTDMPLRLLHGRLSALMPGDEAWCRAADVRRTGSAFAIAGEAVTLPYRTSSTPVGIRIASDGNVTLPAPPRGVFPSIRPGDRTARIGS